MDATNRWRHRRLDREALRAMGEPGDIYRPARWSCEANGTTPTNERKWPMTDTRRPQQPRVLMAELSIRTSSSGNEYLSGLLGKARVIAFKAKERDRYGNEVWQIYLQTPEPRDGNSSSVEPRQRTNGGDPRPVPPDRGDDLDDSLPY